MKLKHYLIASPENHYQPWILSKTAMTCFCISIWVLRMFIPTYFATSAEGLDANDLMVRINAERTNRFIPALITNSKLNAAANIKSQDMIDRSYFAHVNPDGDYVWPVIEAQGYKPYQSLGENLAIDFTSAEKLVSAWMNSPGHRANVLNEKFKDQGMAAVYGFYEPGHDTYLITNLFGTLFQSASADQPQPQPAPATTPVQPSTLNPSPKPIPVTPVSPNPTTQTPNLAPIIEPNPEPAPTINNPAQTTEPKTIEPFSETAPATTKEETSLTALKITLTIFAGFYALFLLLDSFIIQRAQIRRENVPSSPNSLLMLLIALINTLTLWL